MLSNAVIWGEPNIRKVLQVHRDWWAMVADDPSVASDVLERVTASIPSGALSAQFVEQFFADALGERWSRETEASELIPYGMTRETFLSEGRDRLGPDLFREIAAARASRDVAVSFIVAGFDSEGVGHVFELSGSGEYRFVPQPKSLTGYAAIGSGSPGALFMMSYKDVGPRMRAREALYYAVEGKYFGELAYGVGPKTDVRILRHRKDPIVLLPGWLDSNIIEPICSPLQPKRLRKRDKRRLNKLASLDGLRTLRL
jgi:hypothetical protein